MNTHPHSAHASTCPHMSGLSVGLFYRSLLTCVQDSFLVVCLDMCTIHVCEMSSRGILLISHMSTIHVCEMSCREVCACARREISNMCVDMSYYSFHIHV